MPDVERAPYRLTVRPAAGEPGRYEYVVSLPFAEAARSEISYPTPEAAKAAGERRGSELSAQAAADKRA